MIKYFIIALTLVITSSCGHEEEIEIPKEIDWDKDNSSDMHNVFSAEEDDEIELFLKQHQDWKMTKTGTGLRYFIYEKSENHDTAKVYDVVTVDFEISLLDGTHCYSSKENGPESFMVEMANIESGLHEAMQLMCVGDKAKIILPSHLAHGLIGDTEMIPPLSTVIYDIELLKIEKNESE